MEQNTKYLKAWVMQVPEEIQVKRHDLGQPFSTDGTRLEIPSGADPNYRAGLILEIMYHQMSINLFRTFISFTQNHMEAPATERMAISCVKHAITVTSIIYQDLTESSYLKSLQPTCTWQWNAVLVLVGYSVVYPQGSLIKQARKTLDTALSNFNILGRSFTVASGPGQSLSCLISLIDSIRTRHRPSCVSMPVESSILEQETNREVAEEQSNGFVADMGFYLPELLNFAEGSIGEDFVLNLLELDGLT